MMKKTAKTPTAAAKATASAVTDGCGEKEPAECHGLSF